MTDTLSALDLRRWAAQCEEQANDVRCSGEDRARLMKMRASLLALAESADWLEGGKLNGMAGKSSGMDVASRS
jgi:hypothetical protein